jgi:hypothetical protein
MGDMLYIHIHIQTRMHTYKQMHVYKPTYIQTHTHTYKHTYIHTHIHACHTDVKATPTMPWETCSAKSDLHLHSSAKKSLTWALNKINYREIDSDLCLRYTVYRLRLIIIVILFIALRTICMCHIFSSSCMMICLLFFHLMSSMMVHCFYDV